MTLQLVWDADDRGFSDVGMGCNGLFNCAFAMLASSGVRSKDIAKEILTCTEPMSSHVDNIVRS